MSLGSVAFFGPALGSFMKLQEHKACGEIKHHPTPATPDKHAPSLHAAKARRAPVPLRVEHDGVNRHTEISRTFFAADEPDYCVGNAELRLVAQYLDAVLW